MKALAARLEEEVRNVLGISEVVASRSEKLKIGVESVLDQYSEAYGFDDDATDAESKALSAMHVAFARMVDTVVAAKNLEEQLQKAVDNLRAAQKGIR